MAWAIWRRAVDKDPTSVPACGGWLRDDRRSLGQLQIAPSVLAPWPRRGSSPRPRPPALASPHRVPASLRSALRRRASDGVTIAAILDRPDDAGLQARPLLAMAGAVNDPPQGAVASRPHSDQLLACPEKSLTPVLDCVAIPGPWFLGFSL